MTDEELMAWRQRRTGKTVNFGADPGAVPGATPQGRSPLDVAPGDLIPEVRDPAPTPAPAVAAGISAEELEARLQAALGRVAPVQRQAEELRAAAEAATQRAAAAEAGFHSGGGRGHAGS